MWAKFKWDMFVTSFIPLWISIIIFDIWDLVDYAITAYQKKGNPLEKLLSFACSNLIQIISIIVKRRIYQGVNQGVGIEDVVIEVYLT